MMLFSSSLVTATNMSVSCAHFSSPSRSSSVLSPSKTGAVALELGGEVLTAGGIGLDDLQMAFVLHLARQPQTDPPATGDRYADGGGCRVHNVE